MIVAGAFPGETKMWAAVYVKMAIFFAFAVRITGKLLKIDGYMLRGVWQALNCLSIYATYCVIVAGAYLRETKGRSTCDQVAALTTFIKNGFQQNLKTGAVFLDLTAAYDTV